MNNCCIFCFFCRVTGQISQFFQLCGRANCSVGLSFSSFPSYHSFLLSRPEHLEATSSTPTEKAGSLKTYLHERTPSHESFFLYQNDKLVVSPLRLKVKSVLSALGYALSFWVVPSASADSAKPWNVKTATLAVTLPKQWVLLWCLHNTHSKYIHHLKRLLYGTKALVYTEAILK